MKREVLITRFVGNNLPAKSRRVTSGHAARPGHFMWRMVLPALALNLLACVPALSQLGVKGENPPPPARNKSTSKPAHAPSRNVRRTSSAAAARSAGTPKTARGKNSLRGVRNTSGSTQARTVRDAAARPLPFNPSQQSNLARVGSRRKVFVHVMRVGNLGIPVAEKVKSNPSLNPRNKIIEELSKYPGLQVVNSPREADVEIFYDFSSAMIETQAITLPGRWSPYSKRWEPGLELPAGVQKHFQGIMSVVVAGTNPPEVIWQRVDSTKDSGNPYPAAKMARELIKDMKKVRGER